MKMKRTYRLANGRDSVTVTPFGKTASGRTVLVNVYDDSMCFLVHDNKLWYYSGEVYGR